MDVLLIELVLWGGFFLLLWALKNGLGRTDADLESLGLLQNAPVTTPPRDARHYSRPEQVADRIGTYRDQPIYGYAMIGGLQYRFDHVCPEGASGPLRDEERCLQPGLIYVRCTSGEAERQAK